MSEDRTQHLDFPHRMPVVMEAGLVTLAAAPNLLAADFSGIGRWWAP